MKYKSILIIIPAYNEAENIEKVIKSLKILNQRCDFLVVNDGSWDDTGDIAERTGCAITINLPCNLGIGGSVQTGFKYAKNHGYDIAVQFDGDGQHNADEIEKLIQSIIKDTADVVIGSRFLLPRNNYRPPFPRRVGIRVFQVVNSMLLKQKITDNTSGFRAYNRKAVEFLADHYPIDYPEPEAVILLVKNQFRLKEVAVRMNERAGGESSIIGFRSVYYMMKVLLATFITFLRPKIV